MADETKLIEAVEGFEANSFAILYSPNKCWLALFDGTKFVDEKGEIDVSRVFEARVFNSEKELRWLNDADGKGKSTVISDASFPDAIGTITQNYLLWGEVSPNNRTNGNWTEFAEARIGKFHVPIKTTSRAHFTAIEYLCEFADGNVAVIDERLTGISEVK